MAPSNAKPMRQAIIILTAIAAVSCAGDPRWRMREAVAVALQCLLASRGDDTLRALGQWIGEHNWLDMRAVAAAVADPGLLQERKVALQGLHLHQVILRRVLESPERKSTSFRSLRQALGYTISVVTCALPEEGFGWMAYLIASGDPDALWIVRSNLKKGRLTRGFPERVEWLQGWLA